MQLTLRPGAVTVVLLMVVLPFCSAQVYPAFWISSSKDGHSIIYHGSVDNCNFTVEGQTSNDFYNTSYISASFGVYTKNKTTGYVEVPHGVLSYPSTWGSVLHTAGDKDVGVTLNQTTLKYMNLTLDSFSTDDTQYVITAFSSAGDMNQVMPITIKNFVGPMGVNPLNTLMKKNETELGDFNYQLEANTEEQDCFGHTLNTTVKMSCTDINDDQNSVEVTYVKGQYWNVIETYTNGSAANLTRTTQYSTQENLYQTINSTCFNDAHSIVSSSVLSVAALIAYLINLQNLR